MTITRNRLGTYSVRPEPLEVSDADRATLRKLARLWPDGRGNLTATPWNNGTAVTDTYSVRFYDEHTPTAVALERLMQSEPARLAASLGHDEFVAFPGDSVAVALKLKCSGDDSVQLLKANAPHLHTNLAEMIDRHDAHQTARVTLDTAAAHVDHIGRPVNTYRTARPNDIGADLVAISPDRLRPFADLGELHLFAIGSHRPVMIYDERGNRHGMVMPIRCAAVAPWENQRR